MNSKVRTFWEKRAEKMGGTIQSSMSLSQKLKRTFRSIRSTPLHPQWLVLGPRPFSSEISQLENLKVLDIGSADSWLAKKLSASCDYVSLDYWTTGHKLYGAVPDVFGSADSLPFLENSFDVVFLFEVLEHLYNPREAIQEISRCLAPGGRAYITVPFLYPIHDAPHDYQRYTLHGLERELESAGFNDFSINCTSHSLRTACLILCIAISGSLVESIKRRSILVIPSLFLFLLTPLINIFGVLFERCIPSWSSLTSGYAIEIRLSS